MCSFVMKQILTIIKIYILPRLYISIYTPIYIPSENQKQKYVTKIGTCEFKVQHNPASNEP